MSVVRSDGAFSTSGKLNKTWGRLNASGTASEPSHPSIDTCVRFPAASEIRPALTKASLKRRRFAGPSWAAGGVCCWVLGVSSGRANRGALGVSGSRSGAAIAGAALSLLSEAPKTKGLGRSSRALCVGASVVSGAAGSVDTKSGRNTGGTIPPVDGIEGLIDTPVTGSSTVVPSSFGVG